MRPVRKGWSRGANATVGVRRLADSPDFLNRDSPDSCLVSTEPRAPDRPYAEPGSNGHDVLGDLFAPLPEPGPGPEIVRRKPKVKKLRLLLVLAGVSALALISTIFGMMISVAGDLPSLENHAQLRIAR